MPHHHTIVYISPLIILTLSISSLAPAPAVRAAAEATTTASALPSETEESMSVTTANEAVNDEPASDPVDSDEAREGASDKSETTAEETSEPSATEPPEDAATSTLRGDNNNKEATATTTDTDNVSISSSTSTTSNSPTTLSNATTSDDTTPTSTLSQTVHATGGTTTTSGPLLNSADNSNHDSPSGSENQNETQRLELDNATRGTTTITTGAGVATLNLVNLINNSLVNSQGAIVLLDLIDGTTKTLDLRAAANAGDISCSLQRCDLQGAIVSLKADATIENTVLVSAHTGGNSIEDAAFAVIETGPAFANANIVNIANVSLVNARYLVVIVNAFSDVAGDIVLPSLFNLGMSQSTPTFSTTSAQANVANELAVSAGTGSNEVLNAGSSTIATGDSRNSTSLINLLNSTLMGGQSASLMLRVYGQWNGTVYGLPEGAELVRTNGGYLLQFSALTTGAVSEGLASKASTSAAIHNNVTVVAETGHNRVDGADTALIHTGNAHASVNVVNMANAHVVGRNWLLGIINIYGDFSGDIAFGRPNLWVGAEVALPNHPTNGDHITYTYTILNAGDAVARDVTLNHAPSSHLVTGADTPETWQLGTLNPGQSMQVSYDATISDAGDNTKITNRVWVRQFETDEDAADNEEVVTFYTSSRSSESTRTSYRPGSSGTDTVSEPESAATSTTEVLTLVRRPTTTLITSLDRTVRQTLTISNPTERAIPDVRFVDSLSTPNGETVLSEVWELGTIEPFEEITIQYQFMLATEAAPGTYRFSSQLRNGNGTLHEYANGSVIIMADTLPPELEAISTTTNVSSTLLPPVPVDTEPTPTVAGTSTTLERFPGVRVAEAASSEIPLTSTRTSWLMVALLALFVLGGTYRYYRKRRV